MTEPNEVEFHERVEASAARSTTIRIGILAASAVLVLVGAVAVMGASPAPPTTTDPGASAAPTTDPGASAPPTTKDPSSGIRPRFGGPLGVFGFRGGGFGPGGFGGIEVTAIKGSELSLKTDDGWTRTISVTSATTITKAGATIAIGDLAVGDHIRLGQQKASDGTYAVTAIVVVLPTIAGQVSAIDGNTITITQAGGTTAKIHVSGSTRYQVDGVSGSLSEVKVGSFLVAEGTQRADGSLDAAAIHSGLGNGAGPRGPGVPGFGGHGGGGSPKASPAPSTSAG